VGLWPVRRLLDDGIGQHLPGSEVHLEPGPLPVLDTIDPNPGFTSQALGHRAVLEWLGGRVLWWNAYEGIGAPLAAGMHSPAFFPLTALVDLPSGQILRSAQ
jgi:hypothetical protein